MTFFQTSSTSAAGLVTNLNNYNVPAHHIISIVHDGTNFVCFYWK